MSVRASILLDRKELTFIQEYFNKHPEADAVWITTEDMQIWTDKYIEARVGFNFTDKQRFPLPDWSEL